MKLHEMQKRKKNQEELCIIHALYINYTVTEEIADSKHP